MSGLALRSLGRCALKMRRAHLRSRFVAQLPPAFGGGDLLSLFGRHGLAGIRVALPGKPSRRAWHRAEPSPRTLRAAACLARGVGKARPLGVDLPDFVVQRSMRGLTLKTNEIFGAVIQRIAVDVVDDVGPREDFTWVGLHPDKARSWHEGSLQTEPPSHLWVDGHVCAQPALPLVNDPCPAPVLGVLRSFRSGCADLGARLFWSHFPSPRTRVTTELRNGVRRVDAGECLATRRAGLRRLHGAIIAPVTRGGT